MEKQLSQTERLYRLLSDGLPHRSDDIQRIICGSDKVGLFRLAARCLDVKHKYGVSLTGRRDREKPTLYWYQMFRPQNEISAILNTWREENKKPIQSKML